MKLAEKFRVQTIKAVDKKAVDKCYKEIIESADHISKRGRSRYTHRTDDLSRAEREVLMQKLRDDGFKVHENYEGAFLQMIINW